MKPFTKYNSLTGLRMDYLDTIRSTLAGQRCVVTEKVHGANFAARTDGKEVIFSRRNADLVEGESFYGYQYIAKELSKAILEMFEDMKTMIKYHHEAADEAEARGETATRPPYDRDFTTITIRGEFAGGHYPHPDVPQLKTEGHGQVGKGTVWYGQDKNFYAFDMEVDGEVVDFYEMGAYCHSFGIPVVPVLFFGTFDECLEYSTEHLEDDSMVPRMQILLDANGKFEEPQHLPEILGNTREGHVIRPVNPVYFDNGDAVIISHTK